jgi:hypothetical protein
VAIDPSLKWWFHQLKMMIEPSQILRVVRWLQPTQVDLDAESRLSKPCGYSFALERKLEDIQSISIHIVFWHMFLHIKE